MPEEMEPGLEATYYYVPQTVTWSNAVHIAVIEVDIATGVIEIKDYAVAHDSGRLVNPKLVDGQIHGGVAQGIGGALYEEILYDDFGQILTGSFLNYLIPSAMEIPKIRIVHLESPSPLNPLGVKGLGEGGAIAPPAAIANALVNALAPFGVEVNKLPLKPDRVLQLLQRAQSRA
jgi:carbon-monoxide dehydrogenase large subunit